MLYRHQLPRDVTIYRTGMKGALMWAVFQLQHQNGYTIQICGWASIAIDKVHRDVYPLVYHCTRIHCTHTIKYDVIDFCLYCKLWKSLSNVLSTQRTLVNIYLWNGNAQWYFQSVCVPDRPCKGLSRVTDINTYPYSSHTLSFMHRFLSVSHSYWTQWTKGGCIEPNCESIWTTPCQLRTHLRGID